MEICPVCKTEFIPLYTFAFKDYSVFTCPSCRVRFSKPFIDNSEVYKSEYIRKREVYLGGTNLDYKSIPSLEPYMNLVNKKILDIGCGMGCFLEKLKNDNDVLGLEVSHNFESFLIEKGVPYKIGDIENNLLSLPDSYYDLITFWDVFEHLYDPLKILTMVKDKLSPDGIIINWTNNYDDSISLFAEMSYRLSFGNLRFLMEQSFNRMSGHNYNFVFETLDFIYRQTEFKILDTIITDTPAERLTESITMRFLLNLFYVFNKIFKKGKIICHILIR